MQQFGQLSNTLVKEHLNNKLKEANLKIVLSYSIYTTFTKRQNCNDENITDCQGSWLERECDNKEVAEKCLFGVIDTSIW